jgi:hypothetical protein
MMEVGHMKELVRYIIEALVDKPEQVEVTELKSEKTLILELKVAQEDVGKVIGRQGRIIKSVRTLLNAAATKTGRRAVLEVLNQ